MFAAAVYWPDALNRVGVYGSFTTR